MILSGKYMPAADFVKRGEQVCLEGAAALWRVAHGGEMVTMHDVLAIVAAPGTVSHSARARCARAGGDAGATGFRSCGRYEAAAAATDAERDTAGPSLAASATPFASFAGVGSGGAASGADARMRGVDSSATDPLVLDPAHVPTDFDADHWSLGRATAYAAAEAARLGAAPQDNEIPAPSFAAMDIFTHASALDGGSATAPGTRTAAAAAAAATSALVVADATTAPHPFLREFGFSAPAEPAEPPPLAAELEHSATGVRMAARRQTASVQRSRARGARAGARAAAPSAPRTPRAGKRPAAAPARTGSAKRPQRKAASKGDAQRRITAFLETSAGASGSVHNDDDDDDDDDYTETAADRAFIATDDDVEDDSDDSDNE
jgi:hypothetical protein